MRADLNASIGPWRAVALVCVVLSGLVTIVGSGGGGGVSVGGCFYYVGPDCSPIPDAGPPTIEPSSLTLQVGGTAAFTANAPAISNATYQWSRASPAGSPAPIAGATGQTYTLSGVNLADDGASFIVRVQGNDSGRVYDSQSLPARLSVSSMPGIVFEDTEFLPADWSLAAVAQPVANGPTHVEEQVTTGGQPGAYRKTTVRMSAGLSTLYVFQVYAPASYDPAAQGALYVVDFSMDCIALEGPLGAVPTLLLEQAGRRYVAGGAAPCEPLVWGRMARNGFFASDFARVDGPACTAGETCPDFSANGAPIRFGFAHSNEMFAGAPVTSGAFGIDNWRVTAWRR